MVGTRRWRIREETSNVGDRRRGIDDTVEMPTNETRDAANATRKIEHRRQEVHHRRQNIGSKKSKTGEDTTRGRRMWPQAMEIRRARRAGRRVGARGGSGIRKVESISRYRGAGAECGLEYQPVHAGVPISRDLRKWKFNRFLKENIGF